MKSSVHTIVKTTPASQAETEVKTYGRYYAIRIDMPKDVMKQVGWLNALWGTDIFINGIPMIKLFALSNLLIWLAVLWHLH